MAKYTKQQAISIITDCAVKYKENLDGYQLLFILKDKHKHISSLEVSFNPYNFLHLTGIKLADKTTATDFYERCLNHIYYFPCSVFSLYFISNCIFCKSTAF